MIEFGLPKDTFATRALRLMDLVCAHVMQACCNAIGFFLDLGVPAIIVLVVPTGLLWALKLVVPEWAIDIILASVLIPMVWTIGRALYVMKLSR